MNPPSVGKVLGVSAALAVMLPLTFSSPALAQGYGYPPPPVPGGMYSWTDSPDYYGPPGGGPYGYNGAGYDNPQPYSGYDSAGAPGYGRQAYGYETDEGPYNGPNNPQPYNGYNSAGLGAPGYGGQGYNRPQPMFNYMQPPRRMTQGYGSSAAPSGRGRFVVATSGLNLRAGPSDAAPVRASLPGGTPVTLAGPDVGGWRRVQTPYGIGWVFGRYLAPA